MSVRFGVIGANTDLRGGIVFKYFPREEGVLAAICERDPAMVEKFRKTWPEFAQTPVYADYREMLKVPELDAVFIMVRDPYHEEMAVAALEAGKAVYLEKPMAITLEGCDRILEAAYRTGSKLFLGHNMRYLPVVLKMKELIDSGVIGEVQSVWCRHFISYGSCYFRHWCAEQKNCTGLLLQKGAHDIDVIHWLAGGYTERAVGMGRLSVYNRTTDRLAPGEAPDRAASWKEDCWPPDQLKGLSPELDVEDHSMLLMQLDNGVQASYEQCMYTPDSERNYTFIGTRGRLENVGDMESAEVHVWTKRGKRQEPDQRHVIPAMDGSHGGSDAAIIKAFFDFAGKGITPATSPLAARNAVAAGVAGHNSMRNGNMPQVIPPVPAEWIAYFENGQKKTDR